MEFAGGAIQVEADGAIGWLVMNRPERHNAIRRDMWDALPLAIGQLAAAPTVRAIVVRGAGDAAFVSGADIGEFDTQRSDADANRRFTTAVTAATGAFLNVPMPVIAMIDGYCIGGGMVIASACDIRLCTDVSRFGVPAARLGLAYELDNMARLQGIVGRGVAMEMLATARLFSAEEALRVGFVNAVAARPDLESRVREMAGSIASLAPLSLAAAKLSSRAATEPGLLETAQAAIDRCFDSDDFREGRKAFHERRAPVFRGR